MQAWLEAMDVLHGTVDGVAFVWITIPGVGCCEIILDGETAGLRRMYVTPKERRKGAGAAMFHQAIVEAREAGMLALNLGVEKKNTEAGQFYAAMGARIYCDDARNWHLGVNLEERP